MILRLKYLFYFLIELIKTNPVKTLTSIIGIVALNFAPTCSFNKLNKKCHTCKYSYEAGYSEHIPGCEINLDTVEGREEGNCPGWVYEYLEEEREEKINQII